MKYKEDIDKSLKRIEAWWKCEFIDRPVIMINAPRDVPVNKTDYSKYSLTDRWCKPELVKKISEQRLDNTLFLGDALPYMIVTLGPDILGTMYGNDIIFCEGTSGQKHSFNSLDQVIEAHLYGENKWVKLLDEITDCAIADSKDRYFVSLPDLGASAETLSHLVGAEQLCLEIMDNPQNVIDCRNKVMDTWFKMYNHFYNKLQVVQEGSLMWLSAYSKGKTYPLQCDFSAMLSKTQFCDFFLVEIVKQCEFLDNPIYHLDGKEALRHLDALLSIKQLDAIQWCPGASAKGVSMVEWIPIIKKILDSKKAIHIQAKPNEVPILLENLPHAGLLIETYCDNEYQAKELERHIR